MSRASEFGLVLAFGARYVVRAVDQGARITLAVVGYQLLLLLQCGLAGLAITAFCLLQQRRPQDLLDDATNDAYNQGIRRGKTMAADDEPAPGDGALVNLAGQLSVPGRRGPRAKKTETANAG